MRPLQILFFALWGLFALPIVAQNVTVSGQVIDAETQEPIAWAAIFEMGGYSGTYTDEEGQFKFNCAGSSGTLKVRASDYESIEIPFRSSITDTVLALKIKEVVLDEVVITGRQTRLQKKDVSGPTYRKVKSGRKKPRTRGLNRARNGLSSVQPSPVSERAGLLTAGELNDFSKWDLWQDLDSSLMNHYRSYWNLNARHRYTVQCQNESGFPVANAVVKLVDRDSAVQYTARTDNTGKAELWAAVEGQNKPPTRVALTVEYAGQRQRIADARPFPRGINQFSLPVACAAPQEVDIALVVDATMSMADEIEYLKAELQDIITQSKAMQADKDFRFGAVFYRDYESEYLTRKSNLTDKIAVTQRFIQQQSSGSGIDVPEAPEEGLRVALEELEWRPDALRIIFIFLDAPPHLEYAKQMRSMIRRAAEKGVRIVPVIGSGIDKSTEYLLRATALLTNGTYIFLTDDSGIGGAHLKPSTDKWKVETLNEILLRVIYQYSKTVDCRAQNEIVAAETLMVRPPSEQLTERAEDPIYSYEETLDSDKEWKKVRQTTDIAWKYWPNPTSGPLNLETGGKMGQLFVTDISGKLLLRQAMGNQKRSRIDLSGFPAGTYYLKYQYDDEHWLTGKVVVQR
ncbi:MAG: carboxypeptidase-like regulatory domain-containing protein [Bacteroidota bacterium]